MNLKTIVRVLALLLFAGFMSSCASIFTKSSYPITINSEPKGAKVFITNREGKEIYSGKTPAQLSLKPSSSYMRGENYTVKLELPGHETQTIMISSSLEGWYFGNILLGGVIGMLIVDPLTGAMFSIKQETYNVLLKTTDQVQKQGTELQIIDFNSLDAETKKELVQIN